MVGPEWRYFSMDAKKREVARSITMSGNLNAEKKHKVLTTKNMVMIAMCYSTLQFQSPRDL